MKLENHPFLSVVMITYAHEKFIKQAIEGVLMQKTNFDIELIIANDNSPDKSNQIIEEILKNNSTKIRVHYTQHQSNIGMMPNFVWAMSQAKGTYIALCEGDDYWTDPNKLQKQVGFLESNPDFSLCYHKVKEIDLYGNEALNQIVNSLENEKEYNVSDLAKGNFIHTPSVIIRNNFNELPKWFEFSPIGDYPLFMICANHGKIKYLPYTMANYRVGSGIWSSESYENRVNNTVQVIYFLMGHFKNNKEVYKNLYEQRNGLLKSIFYSNNPLVLREISNSLKTKYIIKILFYSIKRNILKFLNKNKLVNLA